jgi:hypothetical protein
MSLHHGLCPGTVLCLSQETDHIHSWLFSRHNLVHIPTFEIQIRLPDFRQVHK